MGADAGRIALRGERGGSPVELDVTLQLRAGKKAKVNGAPLRAAEQLRSEVAALVFTPTGCRSSRARPSCGGRTSTGCWAVLPGAGLAPVEYAAAVGQRNAALRRVAAGVSSATRWCRGRSR